MPHNENFFKNRKKIQNLENSFYFSDIEFEDHIYYKFFEDNFVKKINEMQKLFPMLVYVSNYYTKFHEEIMKQYIDDQIKNNS